MRHAPFAVGPAERDAWLRHMRRAVDALDLEPEPSDALGLPGTRRLLHGQHLSEEAAELADGPAPPGRPPGASEQAALVVQPVHEGTGDRGGAVEQLDQQRVVRARTSGTCISA